MTDQAAVVGDLMSLIASARDLALDVARYLRRDRGLPCARDRARNLAQDLQRIRSLADEVARDPDLAFVVGSELAIDLVQAHELASDLASARDFTRHRATAQDFDRATARARTRELDRALVRARSLARNVADSSARRKDAKTPASPVRGTREQNRTGRVSLPARKLLAAATLVVPPADRVRYADEYQSELWDIAHDGGSRRCQLGYAWRQLGSSVTLRAALKTPRRGRAAP